MAMRRFSTILVFWLAAFSSAHAGDAAAKKSIAYVQKLQSASGGFRAASPKPGSDVPPTLRATTAGVRALKYLGGNLPNKANAVKFVESCWDANSGGFGNTPMEKPDVISTAIGLMAVVELKMPVDKFADAASKYLSENAKAFEEIRMAAAGFEAINKKAPKAREWAEEVRRGQNKGEFAFGKGPGQARDTASAVVTLHRLLGPPPFATDYLKPLEAGQRKNGGWGKADGDADLETTYRVMRYYHMLKTKPGNADAVRSFIAKCRNEDGGYGVAPGQASSVNGTYFAAIVLHWLKE
jgi:hypothetical protein